MISKDKLFNDYIDVEVTPETSRKLQKYLFKRGVYWLNSGKKICNLNEQYLQIDHGKIVITGSSVYYGVSAHRVDVNDIIRVSLKELSR